MKNNFLITLAIFSGFFFTNCTSGNETAKQVVDTVITEVYVAKPTRFDDEPIDKANVIAVADSITYSVIVKNPDPTDEWTEQCLSRVDRQAIAKTIFDAVYAGKMIAFDFVTEAPLSIEEVKEMEKKEGHERKLIGKILFEEEWYLNPEKLIMSKKVNAIMLAYESYNSDGSVRNYKAGIKVYLNKDTTKVIR